jgi:chromosome segregation ATPase
MFGREQARKLEASRGPDLADRIDVQLTPRLEPLQTRLDRLQSDLETLQGRTETVERDLETSRSDLDVLSPRLASAEDRLQALEARCRELADILAERDETIAQLKVDLVATAKRLQSAVEQSDKASIGLLQRIEAVRARVFGPALAT